VDGISDATLRSVGAVGRQRPNGRGTDYTSELLVESTPPETPTEATARTRAPSVRPPTQIENADVAIVTIKKEEFDATLRAFSGNEVYVAPKSHRHYNIRTLDAGDAVQYRVAIVRQLEQGNGEAQAIARDIIQDLSPRLILVVGIAGGVPSKDFTLGDVVLATRVNDYSVHASTSEKTESRSRVVRSRAGSRPISSTCPLVRTSL